ncbi:hypothetical protein M8C21_031722, partial [Ambrosia artemisiifolia]
MSKTRLAILTVASLVLLGAAISLIVMVHRHAEPKSDSTKADNDIVTSIKAVCDNTDYKQTCVDSLTKAKTHSTDPYDHVKTLFEITIAQLDDAAKNSNLMKEAQEDPRTNDALKSCKELAGLAVDDLRRSFDNMNIFNLNDLGQALFQLKIWMSGAISYQQTCLDGFEKTEGDIGERMGKLLKQSMELTSDCLALITDFSQFFQAFGTPPTANRRLLSMFNNDYNFPEWVDGTKRRILQEEPKKITPNVTVALDGKGVYNEIIRIPKNLTHLMVMGDGPDKTRVTGSLNFIDGITTYHTATFAVSGDFFMARDIGFENSAGPEKHQAVALRVSADYTVFYNCRMDGYQDTLYAHTYRQFYRECTISGTIDFIFGDGAVVFQNCIMVVRKPKDNQNCIVTAQGRKESRQPTGLVLQNCSIVADPPEGWLPWNATFAFDTLFYTEFNNHGPGASKTNRVKWPGVKELSSKRINRFTPGKFIIGDTWIPPTGVPYTSGFMLDLPEDNSKDSDNNSNSNSNDDESNDDDDDEDDSSSSKKKKSKKKKKRPKKGEGPAPAESPDNGIPESEISAPDSSPASSPEAVPIEKKET